ncbi:hypothetical protein [Chroococcidiopsis sp. SAG 2025]|nr:hypothetical protein [Chroococcidiopsis sp. SAG 2025]
MLNHLNLYPPDVSYQLSVIPLSVIPLSVISDRYSEVILCRTFLSPLANS